MRSDKSVFLGIGDGPCKKLLNIFFSFGRGPGEFFESLAWFFISQVVVLGRIYWPIPLLAYLLCASLIIEMGNEYMISFV